MKKIYMLALFCLTLLIGQAGTPGGNLSIVNIKPIGKVNKIPIGSWTEGIAVHGTTYPISVIELSALMDEHQGHLRLAFDNIFINNNIVLDLSGYDFDCTLELMVDDHTKGIISAPEGCGLKIIAKEGHKSTLVLYADSIENLQNFKADTVIVSNKYRKYDRIEMNGFATWKQQELDTLLKTASHVGNSITETSGGYKVNDFTDNTKLTINNGVFTMTALSDFADGNGMGFKNMDRDGKLAGTALGAFPANFFSDLSKADGIRFKIDIQNGSVGALNIGLSNCSGGNVFEYFIYGIPVDAADNNGYITLPFSLFEREFWSGEQLKLDQLKVFIIEAIDVSKDTKISFSDIHGYKLAEGTLGEFTIDIQGKKEICAGDSGILIANGEASSYTWYFNGNILSTSDTIIIPAIIPAGSYPVKVVGKRTNANTSVTESATEFTFTVFAPDNTTINDTINIGETYNQNGFDITPTEAGTKTYYDTLVNAHGCDSLIVLNLTAIEKANGIQRFEETILNVYPNPTQSMIFIQLTPTNENTDLYLFDLQGRVVWMEKTTGENAIISLDNLQSGFYLLKANNQTIKIIKQ